MSDDAQRHLVRCPVLAGAALALTLMGCLFAGRSIRASVGLALLAAYIAWASYWGFLAVRRFLVNSGESRLLHLATDLVQSNFHLYGPIVAPVLLGVLYGVPGGWWREFRLTRELAMNPHFVLGQSPRNNG